MIQSHHTKGGCRSCAGLISIFIAALLAVACSEQKQLDPPSKFEKTPVARLRITPAALVLSQPAEQAQLVVEAFDAKGQLLGTLPPSAVTWASSAMDVVAIDRDGIAIGGSDLGLARLHVVAPDGLTASAIAMRLEVAAGVALVTDDQVVTTTEPVTQGESFIGATYRYVHAGTKRSVGEKVLGIGETSIGGVVRAVRDLPNGQEVVFEVVHPTELIASPLEFELPLDASDIVLRPELDAVLEYAGGSGEFIPRDPTAVGQHLSSESPTVRMPVTCESSGTSTTAQFNIGIQQFAPSLVLDVSFLDAPRAIVRGQLTTAAAASLSFEVSGQLEAECRLELGRARFGGLYAQVGILPLFVQAEASFGIGARFAGHMQLPRWEVAAVELSQTSYVRAGIDCPNGVCTYISELSSSEPQITHRTFELGDAANAVANAELDLFGFVTGGLVLNSVLAADLIEYGTGVRFGVSHVVNLKAQLDDPDLRSYLYASRVTRLGAGKSIRDSLAAMTSLVHGWLPIDPTLLSGLPLETETTTEFSTFVSGRLNANPDVSGVYEFRVNVTAPTWLDAYSIGEVQVYHRRESGWTQVAAVPGGGLSNWILSWTPDATLSGPQTFAPVIKSSSPLNWLMEPAGDARVTVNPPAIGTLIIMAHPTFPLFVETDYSMQAGVIAEDGSLLPLAPDSIEWTTSTPTEISILRVGTATDSSSIQFRALGTGAGRISAHFGEQSAGADFQFYVPSVCGDGIIEGYENCEDGNADPDDGCHNCLLDCDNPAVSPICGG